MNCSLVFEYEFSRDGDDFGWLCARLQTPDFSGHNGMWVQWQDLPDFAASLSQCPIEDAKPIICDWGFSEHGRYTPIIKLSITTAGPAGRLVADVLLANYYEPANFCQAQFKTDYPSVTAFQQQIGRMMRKECTEATLSGLKVNSR